MKMKLSLAGVGLLLVLIASVTSCRTVAPPSFDGTAEVFKFESGPYCVVYRQSKLVVFLSDGGDEEVFDRIPFVASGDFVGIEGIQVLSSSYGNDQMTLMFLSKHAMILSLRGTQFELRADGQTFTLDGKTPLWLRCKSDGTVVELDKLPDGFVEFFESPPDNPGLIEKIESYPDAFRK